jgi:large subunit ribosomal protein L6
MSRIGKLPIKVPEKVKVDVSQTALAVEGPKGKLDIRILPAIKIELKDGKIVVTRSSDDPKTMATHGLMRALISNMVTGVSKGFEKQLEIIGVGYKAALKGKNLELSIGYSHPVVIKAPPTISFACEGNNRIKVMGPDRSVVGQIASNIRAVRPPEPYKGKGIRYAGEYVRKKAGKSAVATTA